MHFFPDHLRSCAVGSRVSYPLAAGGRGFGRIVFARFGAAGAMLGIAAEGRRDERNQPIIVPVAAAAVHPAPDAVLDRAERIAAAGAAA